MNQQPFETFRHIGTETKPDCRLCTHCRQLNLFKDEFWCGSSIRCVDASRYQPKHVLPLALWEKRDRATF